MEPMESLVTGSNLLAQSEASDFPPDVGSMTHLGTKTPDTVSETLSSRPCQMQSLPVGIDQGIDWKLAGKKPGPQA